MLIELLLDLKYSDLNYYIKSFTSVACMTWYNLSKEYIRDLLFSI
jgi:hypothetical protein